MNRKAQQVLRQGLALPPGARADLAGALLHSLDVDEGEGVHEAWAEEIGRRLREVESGKVKLIPWEKVQRELRAGLRRGRKKT